MNFILAESSRYPIGSFIDKVKKEFPASSTVSCTRNNMYDVIKKIANPPLLSQGWLVFVFVKTLTPFIVNSLSNPNNVTVYVVRNAEELDAAVSLFRSLSIEYTPVNNLKPDKEDILEYIKTELEVDEEVASYIYNRHHGYLAKIAESVDLLYGTPNITKHTVRKYTFVGSDISFDGVFDFVISRPRRPSYSKVLSLVYQYRYGVKYLVRYLIKKMDNYLKVYDLAMAGLISLEDYVGYFDEHRDEFKGFNRYAMKDALESFEYLSYEKLFFLRSLYKKEQEEGSRFIYVLGLLRLHRAEGEV